MMNEKCKHGIRNLDTNLPYCRRCDMSRPPEKLNKTPATRALELWRLVHGDQPTVEFYCQNPETSDGWKRLGKFVLSLENKLAKLKHVSATRPEPKPGATE